MYLFHKKRGVYPEPGDIFKVVIDNRIFIVKAEKVEDPTDYSGCLFEKLCETGNKTEFVCLGEDRPDKLNVKFIPINNHE